MMSFHELAVFNYVYCIVLRHVFHVALYPPVCVCIFSSQLKYRRTSILELCCTCYTCTQVILELSILHINVTVSDAPVLESSHNIHIQLLDEKNND